MHRCFAAPFVTAALLIALATPVASAKPPATGRTVVLGTMSLWRMHHTLRPPMIETEQGVEPLMMDQQWLNAATAPPAGGWQDPAFDDDTWLRGSARKTCRTPYLARLSMRGRFLVNDPAAVDGLTVSVAYHGGAVVTVNGTEIGRGHLPAGDLDDAALADGYPTEACFTADGGWIGSPEGFYVYDAVKVERDAEFQRRQALHARELAALPVPSAILRKGVNVVAVEVIAAPYDPMHVQQAGANLKALKNPYHLLWNNCQINSVQLTAATAAGLETATSRPRGIQIWNSDAGAGDFDMDYGIVGERLHPVRIAGARNGRFSGKVVVGSDSPIAGLDVSPGTLLAADGSTIGASSVQIRYALPWGEQTLTNGNYRREPSPYPRNVKVLACLAETPLDEFPVIQPKRRESGAVVPIWITVNVPKDAAAGVYTGTVTVAADAMPPREVTVALTVADWTLPDVQQWQTWLELIQSPDTLALEYGVPLWSDEHFALIAQSMRHLGAAGSRVLHIPLIAHANVGNAGSMVRWIRRGDGSWDFDFSIMDRYLDIAAEHMGAPKLVIFNVWDIFLVPAGGSGRADAATREFQRGVTIKKSRQVRNLEALGVELSAGVPVTRMDPVTGDTENILLPLYTDPASKAPWQRLFAELHNRMAVWRLKDTMMLGMLTDVWASKEEMQFFQDVAGDVPWVNQSHNGFAWGDPTKRIYGIARVGYQATVWATQFAHGVQVHGKTWPERSMYGWRGPALIAQFNRDTRQDLSHPTYWRHYGERNIVGGQRGMGRIGADMWPVIRDKRGRRKGRAWERFPESHWNNLNITSAVLAPGPDGPVATPALEAMREGIQECEARIAIERALLDEASRKRLGPDLVARCEQLLAERHSLMFKTRSSLHLSGPGWSYGTVGGGVSGHYWFIGSAWQDRTAQLFDLAGEVTASLEP